MGNTVYINKRPQRIVFIVSDDALDSDVNEIVTYNIKKWGGRYNPIFIKSNGKVDNWCEIENYDPDIIKSVDELDLSDVNHIFIYDIDLVRATALLVEKIIRQYVFNQDTIQVLVNSKSASKIEEIKAALAISSQYNVDYKVIDYKYSSILPIDFDFNKDKGYYEIHKIVENEKNTIRLDGTQFDNTLTPYGYYMADFYISFEDDGNDIFERLILPHRNPIAFEMFNSDSRITLSGVPAAPISLPDQVIELVLLDNERVFNLLLSNKKRLKRRDDARQKIVNEKLLFFKRSSNGKFLDGFIELTKSLELTYNIVKERYWRNIIDVILRSASRVNVTEEIRNKIKKDILYKVKIEKDTDGWIDGLLSISQKIAVPMKEIPFSCFRRLAWSELSEFNRVYVEPRLILNKKCLKDSISKLVE